MSLEDIEQAIEFVAPLSTRNVLCNCALCYPHACSLVERAVNKNKWVAFATSTSHATKYPRAAHEYPVEPLVHNPDPTPQLRFTHSQVVKGLESARLQALAAPQQGTSSSPSAPESPASSHADEAGSFSPASPPPPPMPPVSARTQPYLAPQCRLNGRYMIGFWSDPRRKRPTIEQLRQRQPGNDGSQVIGRQGGESATCKLMIVGFHSCIQMAAHF